MPTYTTLPLLILIVMLWRWTRGNVLAIVAFTAIFNAASALNLGSLGIAPWLFSLAICLPLKAVTIGVRWHVTRGINRPALNLVLAFIVYAGLSGVLLPIIYSGVRVSRLMEMVPLSLGMANVSQLCYLAAAAAVFFLAVTSTSKELDVVMDWYVTGCIVAGVLAVYQLANAVLHVPYPSEVFYSNPAHTIFSAYKIGGLWRLNSTFTEASDMAGSLIGGLGVLVWEMMVRPPRFWRVASAGLLLVVIVMSLSTTGYLCLALMFVVAGAVSLQRLFTKGEMGHRPALVALVFLLVSVTGLTVSTTARTSVMGVMSMVVLDKQQTDSYRSRTESHGDALQTLVDTNYMGAGWGSTRASGAGYTLLASVGIFGFALFCAGCAAMYLPLLRRKRGCPDQGDLLQRSLFAMLLLLAGMMIAGSEPIAPMLWILFGTAVVAAGPMREVRQVALRRDARRFVRA
jgi:hypothetical protein